MGWMKMAKAAVQLGYSRLTWNIRDTSYKPAGLDGPKFMSARDAVRLIKDGDCVINSGIAGCARCSIFYWALAEGFAATEGPKNLTWVANAGTGGRGKAPGTLEELDAPGLIATFIAGHLETFKSLLKAGQEGRMEIHTMPQGVIAYLLEAQTAGEDSIVSDVGVGTFLDPRVGAGTLVTEGGGESYVGVEGDRLKYRLPKIDVALFVASSADRDGNIYMDNMATLTESRESALAAKKNNGKVMVAVSRVREKKEDEIYLPASQVDAVVVNPANEQVGGVKQNKYWPMFTQGAKEDVDESLALVDLVNAVLRITPVRTEPEMAMARLAASIVTEIGAPGANINIGVGLPEQVCRLIREGGLAQDVKFGSESGVYGGIPTSGVYFGAAINPLKLMSSAEIFHFWEDNLDVTVLGILEVDSAGNLNVSKRGEGPLNHVGPGGFTNLVHYAKNIVFIGSWMANAEFAVKNGKLSIVKSGAHKFKEKIGQVTFNGKKALALGKKIFYATNVGAFRLTERGMELCKIMPGLDLQKDIIDPCPMTIVLPEGGPEVVESKIVTGVGFTLKWK